MGEGRESTSRKAVRKFQKKIGRKIKYADLLFSENLTAWTFKEVSVLWAVSWPTHLAVEIHSLLHAVKSKLNCDYKRNNPMSVCCTTKVKKNTDWGGIVAIEGIVC